MKVFSVGRDVGCNISYDNAMISRRHALIKVYSSGKVELISQGKNGTFVNGIMCKQNVPYPIKRKDVISFAHVCELDWALIPNPLSWVKYVILGVSTIAVIIGISIMVSKLSGNDDFKYDDTEQEHYRPSENENIQSPKEPEKEQPKTNENKQKTDSIDFSKFNLKAKVVVEDTVVNKDGKKKTKAKTKKQSKTSAKKDSVKKARIIY